MADIRIKDLATTATTTASDDFMAVDGATNGTRKLSAATPAFLTSVTTPSLTAPASTDLTLAGGSSGASLVLGQGVNGGFSATPKGTSAFVVNATVNTSPPLAGASGGTLSLLYASQYGLLSGVAGSGAVWLQSQRIDGTATTYPLQLNPTGSNVLIGGTTDITGSGGLKVFGTTAASSTTTGALQVAGGVGVAGGIYAGAASVFGGNVSLTNGFIYSKQDQAHRWTSDGTSSGTIRGDIYTDSTGVMVFRTGASPTSALSLGATQAATFSGAVTAASLATAQTAAAATSIVITHKIPITLNGTVYYMALTATP